jgi:hypothetical protein
MREGRRSRSRIALAFRESAAPPSFHLLTRKEEREEGFWACRRFVNGRDEGGEGEGHRSLLHRLWVFGPGAVSSACVLQFAMCSLSN